MQNGKNGKNQRGDEPPGTQSRAGNHQHQAAPGLGNAGGQADADKTLAERLAGHALHIDGVEADPAEEQQPAKSRHVIAGKQPPDEPGREVVDGTGSHTPWPAGQRHTAGDSPRPYPHLVGLRPVVGTAARGAGLPD